MSEYPRDEFDDVPEDGARQGVHRGHNPAARGGSRREFRAILVTGLLTLVLGAVCFVNAPRTAQDAAAAQGPVVPVASVPGDRPARAGTATSPAALAADVSALLAAPFSQ